MRALIAASGAGRAALAAVRGLAAAGWEVGVAAPERSIATTSRHCARWHRVPTPGAALDGFVDGISSAVAAHRYDVVLPAGDGEALALSLARDRLDAAIPLPDHTTLLAATDKLELTRAAAAAGFAVPRSWAPGEPAPPELRGPVVVKPRLHFEAGSAPMRRPAAVVPDVAAAEAAVARIEQNGGRALMQEHVAGGLMAWVGLFDRRSQLVASAQQEAVRTHPPDAGVTARGVTVPVSAEVTRKATALLGGLGWTGLAQLQFVVPRDGAPALVDLNPRVYGSMALAIAAGVNLPALLAETAMGRSVERIEARPGVRYQWLEGDLRTSVVERRKTLPRDVADALRWSAGAHHGLWRRDDPRPVLIYCWQSGVRLLHKLRPAPQDAAAPEQ